MAFTKCYVNEIFGTLLVLSALLSTTSAVDCYGKSFRCVNSTHFMICVDLGGGVSQVIEDFYIACPPPTVCQGNNHFECEFPAPPTSDTILNNAISGTTLPWEEIVTVSSLNNTNKEFSENYMDTTVEKGTTTAIEYSVTTDTTVDVTSKTVPDIYINNELNVTEVAATISAETTTTAIEILPQSLSEVNVVTQTTESIPTTVIESVAQSAAETINVALTQIVGAGEESISSAINNTQTTTEHKVITDTVTEQPAPIITEQIIQTTTNDPLEQEPSSLYTVLPQVITLFQNVSLTNNTLLKESHHSVVNENIQAIEKTKIFSLVNGTKNNKDVVPISEKPNVIQPDNIFQNVEITSTVESIVENTTAAIEHLTTIPSDKISTDVYHGFTASSFDIKLKLNPSGVHEDTPAPTKLEGSIQSKVTSEKQQNKTSQINKTKHALDEIKHTIGESVFAPNKENPSTTANNDDFPELPVTTVLPFVNDVEANANMTNKNVIANKPITDYTYAQNNKVTTLDGIVAIETFGKDSSSDQPTSINEGQLTKESTQNFVTEHFDFVTNANTMNTNVIDNKPVTDYYEVTTTLGGIVATETFGKDSSSDQPTTINEGQLTKESTQNVVTENFDFVTNANIMNRNVKDNKPIIGYYEVTTNLDGIVATETFGIDSSADQASTINEGQLTKESMQNVITENFDFVTTEAGYITISNSNVQSVTTEVPFVTTKSQNSVDNELGGAFIVENVETTASTDHLTTTSQQSLKIHTTKNFVTENNFIPTNEAINQDIMSTEVINKPIKDINAQPMMIEVPSFVTNIQNFEDTTLDPALKVNEEMIPTYILAIITAQPMVTEGPHIKRQKLITQNLDKTELDKSFITENVENTASTEQPTTVYEQRLTVDTNQNVVTKNDFIPTSETVYQGIVSVEATYEPTTMTNLHSTMTLMTKKDDKKIDSASIVEFGASTEQIKTIDKETRATNTPDVVNAKPMMTKVPSPGTNTQNSAGMKLGEEFINKTTENIGSMKRPNTIHEQSLIVDTTHNDVVENIVIPTSEAVNRGIMSTAGIHEASSIINLQPMTTEASTLVTIAQNTENTKQDAAFIIKDVEVSANSDRIGITDTSANVATEKITIPANDAVHTVINNTQSPTTEALLLTMTVQNPITKHISKDVAVNTQIEENSAMAEKAITINKGTSTTKTEQNLASENSVTPTRHAVNLDITTRDTRYTLTTISNDNQIPVADQGMSNKAQIITIPTSVPITDRVLNSETVGNSVGTTQSASIKEESVTTSTADNVASIIIPKTQTGKENKTVNEDVNVTIIISNAQPTPKDNKDAPLPSFEQTSSITETGSTSVVTSKPVLQQKKQQLSENNLVPGAGRENVVELTSGTYDLTSTNAIELNFNMESTMASIQGDIVMIDKGSNPMDMTTPSVHVVNINDHTILSTALSNDKHLKASAINIDHTGYANQDHFKIGTKISSNPVFSGINVPENLPSLQYMTHGISKQNTNIIDLSTTQAPEKESNYISNLAFMSQHGKSETMLVTNDSQSSTVQENIIKHNSQADNVNSNPLESYLIDKSNQNLESSRKSSVNLNVEENDVDTALPDVAFVSQQPIKSALPASTSISDGLNNRELSTTGMKMSTQISTNVLMENITKLNSDPEVDTLPAPDSKMIAKEDSINLKTSTLASDILAHVSSSRTVPTGTTVADTSMVDNIQRASETITAFIRPGSKSTVVVSTELGSNDNVFPDKIESEYPKNSNDPIPPRQSVIYQYKLTNDSQDFSETTSTKGNIITEKVNASSKPHMLNVFPVPINNVELRSSVKNIPVIMDLTTQVQNGNIIQITESYKSVTFNPALTNTGTHAGINGVDITTAPTLRNPILKLQAGVTDKGNASPRSPTFGDSAIVGNLAKNIDVTIFSTLSDASSNSPTEVIDRADVSLQQPQLIELRPVEKTSANTPYANIPPNSEQKENKNIQNVLSPILTDMPMVVTLELYPEIKKLIPKSVKYLNSNVPEGSIVNTVYQKTNFTVITDLKYNSLNGSETKSEPQQNNSPTNHALSPQTRKTYASSTVRVPSQSVTQKLIPRTKNINKPVTNDTQAFNCIKGIRGRYSDKDDCRKFYICLGIDRPIVGNCPENTVFSDVKKLCTKILSHCIRQNEFKCPSAGRFSDFMKDNVYYICVSHKNHLYKFKFQCQIGYILNKTIVKCIETKEIESNESVSISSSDSSRQTGSTSTVSSSTSSNSISSSITSNTSNGGDSSSKSEDSSKTKKSNEAEETPEQPEGTKKEDDEEEEVFKCKKEGKFPIRNECRRYYLCKKKGSQYRRKVKKCDSGSVFHKDKKKCVDDDDYEC